MPQVLREDYDIVIDAIDVFNCKLAFLRYAFKHEYKIYSSMGAGNRVDPTKIRTGDLFKSKKYDESLIVLNELIEKKPQMMIHSVLNWNIAATVMSFF